METNPQPIAKRRGIQSWLWLWIVSGLVLAVVLLVSSISTYALVSGRLIVDHLRRDLSSRVAMMDEQMRQASVHSQGQLSAILQQALEKSNGRIAWILVQNSEGEAISQTGAPAKPVFSNQEIRSHLQSRQPIFKTIDTTTGMLLVEVFPFRLPAAAASPSKNARRVNVQLAGYSVSSLPHQFVTVQIAEFVDGAGTALWSLKRNVLISSSAALMLLISLSVIALRLRSYRAGRELEEEVEIAGGVQRDLLPSASCQLASFEVASAYVPLSRVGGDFHDAFPVRGGRTAFVLGDVSGSGIPAALLMGVLHGAARSIGWTESPLDHQEATAQINRLLCERAATARFATMFWSYFDSRSEHLKYINAGHCPPLLVKASQRKPTMRLTSGGPVLGLLAGAEFQNGSVRLERGDVLVLYSDGIIEAKNAADEEFGEDRVLAVVRTHHQDTADAIRNHILAAVDAFTGAAEPQDDRTLVVIVYLGQSRDTRNRELEAESELVACAA